MMYGFQKNYRAEDASGSLKKYMKTLNKNKGLPDRTIPDTILGVNYFNFVNRIVPGLGVKTDENESSGYKY